LEIAAIPWNDKNDDLLIIPNTRIREIFISKIVTLGIFQIADINFIMKIERRVDRAESIASPDTELNTILKAFALRIMYEKFYRYTRKNLKDIIRSERISNREAICVEGNENRAQFDRNPIHNEATSGEKKIKHVYTRSLLCSHVNSRKDACYCMRSPLNNETIPESERESVLVDFAYHVVVHKLRSLNRSARLFIVDARQLPGTFHGI